MIQRQFFSYDRHFEHDSPMFEIPSLPGLNRLYYSYGSNVVEFHVIECRLEAFVLIPLSKPSQYFDKLSQQTRTRPRAHAAWAVSAGGGH